MKNYKEEFNQFLLNINVLVEDTNDKKKIKESTDIIATFKPIKEKIVIE